MSVLRAESMPGLLGPWLTEQRWYAAKGTVLAGLERAGGLWLADPGRADSAAGPATGDRSSVRIDIHMLTARSGDGSRITYQVPLTYRAQREPTLEHALIGVFEHPVLGDRWVYDGPHDPAFVTALLRLLNGGRAGSDDGRPGGAVGIMQRAEPPPTGPARVLTGEQSNTSIIVDPTAADAVIVKLFRVLQAGTNPDVVVQTRLAAVGCDRVPRPVGWIEGSWIAPGPSGATADGSLSVSVTDGELVSGHLAYACEFIRGGEDAWRVACRAVEAGQSFAGPARELGVATALVHTALTGAMPTRQADAALAGRLADGLAGRVRWAVGLVPGLEPYAAAALAAVDAVRSLHHVPALQQVHGDYHLGQVLASGRGWVLLDFEGEPLRPMADRLEPDLALRDVAGMLRSFDYAAGHATVELATDDPRAQAAADWAAQARDAFLAGYAAAAGHDPRADGELLRALELDKAMYEVVYETLNRPTWVAIPLSAVRRLASPLTLS
jgi:predicted trehalose synthase